MQMAVRKIHAVSSQPDFSAVLEHVRHMKAFRSKEAGPPRIDRNLLRLAAKYIDGFTGRRALFLASECVRKRDFFRSIAEKANIEISCDSNLYNVTQKMGQYLRTIETVDIRTLERLERFYEQLAIRQHDLPYL